MSSPSNSVSFRTFLEYDAKFCGGETLQSIEKELRDEVESIAEQTFNSLEDNIFKFSSATASWVNLTENLSPGSKEKIKNITEMSDYLSELSMHQNQLTEAMRTAKEKLNQQQQLTTQLIKKLKNQQACLEMTPEEDPIEQRLRESGQIACKKIMEIIDASS